MDYSETDAKSRGNEETTSSVPLSEYAKKLVGDMNGISGGEGVHFGKSREEGSRRKSPFPAGGIDIS